MASARPGAGCTGDWLWMGFARLPPSSFLWRVASGGRDLPSGALQDPAEGGSDAGFCKQTDRPELQPPAVSAPTSPEFKLLKSGKEGNVWNLLWQI